MQRTYRIIIADDEEAHRILMSTLLEACIPEEEMAEIETVSDGTDLLNRLECRHYDLVFTDNQMPRLTGENAIKNARSSGYQTPMFLVSSDIELPEIAKDAGATGYLQKGKGLKTGIEQIATRYLK